MVLVINFLTTPKSTAEGIGCYLSVVYGIDLVMNGQSPGTNGMKWDKRIRCWVQDSGSGIQPAA